MNWGEKDCSGGGCLRLVVLMGLALAVLVSAVCNAEGPPPLTVGELKAALDANPTGTEAEGLAAKLRAWFGTENLKNGASPKVDGLSAAWAVEATGTSIMPEVTLTRGISNTALSPTLRKSSHRLQRIGDTDVYALVETFGEGEALLWSLNAGGKELKKGNLELYTYPSDSIAHEGVPIGKLTQQPKWKSRAFEATERHWWGYGPAQYKDENPACVMALQGGGR